MTASVRALRPESKGRYRRALAVEWVRDRFWVVPTLFVVAGVLAGLVVARVDSVPGLREVVLRLPVSPSAAELILGIIATSMLTFVGVVFTTTLVALQLASAQLSPRVLRTFVRSGVTKAAFGFFLATFAYAVVVLVAEGSSTSEAVLRGAVTVGVVLVSASLVVFVVYVTATMRLLQVSWVVTAVANETRAAVAANYPPESAYRTAVEPSWDATPRLVRLAAEDDEGHGGELGVVLAVDSGRLVELAARPAAHRELRRPGRSGAAGCAAAHVGRDRGPRVHGDRRVRRVVPGGDPSPRRRIRAVAGRGRLPACTRTSCTTSTCSRAWRARRPTSVSRCSRRGRTRGASNERVLILRPAPA